MNLGTAFISLLRYKVHCINGKFSLFMAHLNREDVLVGGKSQYCLLFSASPERER